VKPLCANCMDVDAVTMWGRFYVCASCRVEAEKFGRLQLGAGQPAKILPLERHGYAGRGGGCLPTMSEQEDRMK
jgi:hypothetical protein